MKRTLFILLSVIFATTMWGQAPQKIGYQAVIRNSSNNLVGNQTIGMKISILQGSPNGTAVYEETHAPKTNSNGLVTIEIGCGEVAHGIFKNINWANGTYFIKTETDLEGGANYTITGTSQLLSVPFALYSEKSRSAENALTLIYTSAGF